MDDEVPGDAPKLESTEGPVATCCSAVLRVSALLEFRTILSRKGSDIMDIIETTVEISQTLWFS